MAVNIDFFFYWLIVIFLEARLLLSIWDLISNIYIVINILWKHVEHKKIIYTRTFNTNHKDLKSFNYSLNWGIFCYIFQKQKCLSYSYLPTQYNIFLICYVKKDLRNWQTKSLKQKSRDILKNNIENSMIRIIF